TGIANEKDWGISLNEHVNESGVNEDGSTWYRESGEDFGENGLRCRWTKMGGKSDDGSSEWKETWWEKSDWSGYKELGGDKGLYILGGVWMCVLEVTILVSTVICFDNSNATDLSSTS
ncbi:hypothetical protein Tco_1488433, partial [Tanacetum coccineum]